MYAIMIDGLLYPAERHLFLDDIQVYNPTPEQYAAAGYKPVIFVDPPLVADGYYNEMGWRDDGETITQTWTMLVIPSSTPAS